jgi:hypothetical protein
MSIITAYPKCVVEGVHGVLEFQKKSRTVEVDPSASGTGLWTVRS